MILPSSYLFTLILLAAGLLAWGSWATTFKAAGPKWRFELYYYDFAAGLVLGTLILGLTLGMFGWDGFSLVDDVRNAGKRQELWAFLGGGVFNLANMLLLGSVSLAGMAVGFPIAMGIGLIVGTAWTYFANPGGSPMLLAAGCLCILVAVVVDAMAFKSHSMAKLLRLVEQGKTKSTKKTYNGKGVFLAVVSGVLMGCFPRLVELARDSEVGLGPYSIAFIMAAGVLFSTFVYNLFFMNLPIAGRILDFSEYFKGTARNHFMGILGGLLMAGALVAAFVAVRVDGPAAVLPSVSAAVMPGAAVVAALWGLMVWKEFDESDSKVKALVTAMLVLFVVGLLLVTAAPAYGIH